MTLNTAFFEVGFFFIDSLIKNFTNYFNSQSFSFFDTQVPITQQTA